MYTSEDSCPVFCWWCLALCLPRGDVALALLTATFPAPSLSRASVGVRNAPSSGGLMATLSGLAFASRDTTPTATVASVDCATSSWMSGTTVECLMASAIAGTRATTVVTVAGVTGTLDGFFTFDGA